MFETKEGRVRRLALSGDGWARVIVLLGVVLRLRHYLRNPAMWHDEAAVVVNVLDKDFGALLGPVKFHLAAPPLFLWIERGMALLLGDSTYVFRLLPMLASLAALLLFWDLARRTLPPSSVSCALLLFACSDRMLWHTCEAKPYATDVFLATLLPLLFCRLRTKPVVWQCGIYTLLSLLILSLSYPGMFLCGGLLVALLPQVRRSEEVAARASYALLVSVIVICSLLLVMGPVRAQHDPEIDRHFAAFFPPWQRPASVPLWALLSAMQGVDYCFRPFGAALLPLVIWGGFRLWRDGERALTALLVVPIGMAFLAACLHRYPFGGARVLVYALPCLALLIARSFPDAWEWLRRYGRSAPLLLLPPILAVGVMGVWRALFPWPRAASDAASAYVLARSAPEEPITANDWEFVYYFRKAGRRFHWERNYALDSLDARPYPLTSTIPAARTRFWLVLEAKETAERQALLDALLPSDWQVTQTRDFAQVSVFVVSRRETKSIRQSKAHGGYELPSRWKTSRR